MTYGSISSVIMLCIEHHRQVAGTPVPFSRSPGYDS